MKCLERNKQDFYYLLFEKKEEIKDEKGRRTGESRIVYRNPVKFRANISAAKGETSTEQFGSDLKYDKVIVIDDINCPIDENSVLFVDKAPEVDSEGNPSFDYIVKKVARSLNSVSLAISKVSVS